MSCSSTACIRNCWQTPPISLECAYRTRRDAAEYLAEEAEADSEPGLPYDAGFWSWLGMYYFAQTAPRAADGRVKLSTLDETFVVHNGEPRS